MSFNSYNYIDGNVARKVEEGYSNIVYVQPRRVAQPAPVRRAPEQQPRAYRKPSAQPSVRHEDRRREVNDAIVTNWNVPTNLQLLGMSLAMNALFLGTLFLTL